MTDLIPRDAAIAAITLGHTVTQHEKALRAIPAIYPAAIREAVLKEAAELCDRYPYVEGVKTAILALIGEKK